MPIYEYRCRNGHQFEVVQRMADEPIETCEECGAPVERVFHPVAVHFKGSGFYTTDYAKKSTTGAGVDGDSASGGGEAESKGDSGSKSESGSKKSDSKSGDSGSKAESGGDKAKASSKSD